MRFKSECKCFRLLCTLNMLQSSQKKYCSYPVIFSKIVRICTRVSFEIFAARSVSHEATFYRLLELKITIIYISFPIAHRIFIRDAEVLKV